MTHRSFHIRPAIMVAAMACGLASGPVGAADHIDMPQSVTGATTDRPDASISDFYAFVSGFHLVLIMNLHPFMAPDDSNKYVFPTDVAYRFNIDLDSDVTIGTDVVSREFGGIVTHPNLIQEDVVFEIKFDAKSKPTLRVTCPPSLSCDLLRKARLFAGLRAESFIFAPVVRNNVASIVLEVPAFLLVPDPTKTRLLLWATSTVDMPNGDFTDLAGRADRSQFNQSGQPLGKINALHPSQHVAAGFVYPDVMIYDIARPAAFPNGRGLTENVNQIVDGFTLLPTDHLAAATEINGCLPGGFFYPCPIEPPASSDDVRLLGRFPYLGKPYRASERRAKSSDID